MLLKTFAVYSAFLFIPLAFSSSSGFAGETAPTVEAEAQIPGVGSLHATMSEPGEPVYAPRAMTVEVRCEKLGTRSFIFLNEPLCAFDAPEVLQKHGILRLRFVLPVFRKGHGGCDSESTRQDFDLRELCDPSAY